MIYILRFIKIIGILSFLAVALLFFQFNVFAMQFAQSWQPGTGWIVFLSLCGVELLGCLLLTLAWYPRRSKLVLRANPTPEQREVFAREMYKRLRENQLVRQRGINPSDQDFVPKALAVLDEKADQVIRSDSRKIFLGTALAQNGRLDALIVFVALTRMVWRISKVYNQRPTPAEIWSVYTTVSTSAFIAFSIDALDIPRTVTEALNSLVPAVGPYMAGSSLPFMSSAMHIFTTSILDGAANGLLAIRAGVLCKNAFRYRTLEEQEQPGSMSREVTATMLSLSKECLTDITVGLKNQVKGMAASMADSCVEKTRDAAQNISSAVTDKMSAAGDIVIRGGEAMVNSMGSTADAVSDAAKSVVNSSTTVITESARATKSFMRGAGSLFSRLVPGKKQKKDDDA